MTRRLLPAAGLLATPCLSLAHGFGQRYDLPLPLWLYLTGAGLTVALSFAFLALWRRDAPAAPCQGDHARLLLRRIPGARALAFFLRLLVLALYVLVIVAGLVGVQNPVKNIAPAMVWAIWWVGMAYVSALVGDLWALVNPLDSVARAAQRLCPRRRAPFGWPAWLDSWPATLLFFCFIWMELNWEGSEQPASLAWAMLLYSAFTWAGMALFGRATWLRNAEVFHVVFGLLARFAPNTLRDGAWYVRPYAAGLLVAEPVHRARLVLVILMLAAVSFDGMMETQAWYDIVDAVLAVSPGAIGWITTAALLLMPALFLAVFLLFCLLVARCGASDGRPPLPLMQVAGRFVLTLVPIAIAYHFAHYLSFLAMAGQYLIPLASDPLGLGWDLCGTRLYFIRLGIVDAKAVWYVSLFAIVAGHVAAVWLAHVCALRLFAGRRAALRSQYPMLALMVAYTLLSLWIIAQPIVGG
ncbi:hypothetical protein [Janthinobacterium sp. 1_2014MBL_MicDiv]|uniref:hypothetical protein n=1 Tax=Janthinobacterium sp. 1_2014MBL_MicDiv TaxID=1644131 RepID=UPI0008F52208|nr:hypothetical protein [Janthinobacterium sp. 1_2014MBL_MicDiv]APA69999.1 hypothetical protein YQ44_21930 [Janthinobacterium sp. 1_2014MBL_MicDiv]